MQTKEMKYWMHFW